MRSTNCWERFPLFSLLNVKSLSQLGDCLSWEISANTKQRNTFYKSVVALETINKNYANFVLRCDRQLNFLALRTSTIAKAIPAKLF